MQTKHFLLGIHRRQFLFQNDVGPPVLEITGPVEIANPDADLEPPELELSVSKSVNAMYFREI